MKRQTIRHAAELDRLEALVSSAAAATVERMRDLFTKDQHLAVLALLKFTTSGCDPLNSDRPLNLVEQLNQSFTYLASIAGARWLLERHPTHAPFVLNLGTASGSDIVSEDGQVAAETFAATDPDSNDKLRKDVAKVAKSAAKHKYVFFLSPIPAKRTDVPGVTVVKLDHTTLSSIPSINDA